MIETSVHPGKDLYTRLFTLAVVITVLTFGWFSWTEFSAYRFVFVRQPVIQHLEELRGQILLFDEVLTMSARMAAATGDVQWEARYRRFDPQLDRALKEVSLLLPTIERSQAVAQTDAANIKLVAMENQAFHLARQGQIVETQHLLSGKEYEDQKKIYAAGMEDLTRLLKQAITSAQKERQTQVVWSGIAIAISIPFSLLAWWLVMRAVRRSQAILKTSNQQLRQQSLELENFTLQLDEKVSERTKALKESELATLNMMDDVMRGRERTEQAFAALKHEVEKREQVEESNTRLAMAVEQAVESMMITDARGNILYVNPAFEKTSGFTRTEAFGQNLSILKSGKHDAAFYPQMWDMLTHGEVWHGHLTNKRKDGKLYEEESSISPLRDATGKIVNYIAVNRDVTREVQLEAQFRQSQKMEAIGTLASGVAHDFNNILAVIQIQAGLLKSEVGLSAQQAEYTDGIGEAVQRAANLTRQLLLFSRKEVLQMRDLDLNRSVVEMTKMLKRILGENIAVQLKLATQPMLLHADAGMIDQVVMNLAVNARDAMPDGGQLVIETSGVDFDEFATTQTAHARPGSFVCLYVSDTGCGIPAENLSKIFEPFFTTKGVGKGTGLGLATVFGIAQQHHGWINVYSEVGRGTTFKVYLPRMAESHDTKIFKKVPATAQTGHETILLVEDEPALRTVIEKTLTRLGYRVLEASTGFNALEVWKEHAAEIHLLLTDLMMPDGMTGKDLGQRLLQENPKLRVIYMSGYSDNIVAKDFPLQVGVNFLAKPFQTQHLSQIIRQRLDAPRVGT